MEVFTPQEVAKYTIGANNAASIDGLPGYDVEVALAEVRTGLSAVVSLLEPSWAPG